MASYLFRFTRRFLSTSRSNWSQSSSMTVSELYQAVEQHAMKTTSLWRNISLFVAIPGVLLVTYNAYKTEKEHEKHIEEHGRPEFIPFPHLRVRSKPFPWGDGNHSLFHNPHTNPLPEGYEDADH